MSWINPTKTSKKIDNYVKINDMKPCDLLNLMMVWMSKYTSFTVRLSDMRPFTVQCALIRPFYPEPGELQVYFLLYQNAIKLYCVF